MARNVERAIWQRYAACTRVAAARIAAERRWSSVAAIRPFRNTLVAPSWYSDDNDDESAAAAAGEVVASSSPLKDDEAAPTAESSTLRTASRRASLGGGGPETTSCWFPSALPLTSEATESLFHSCMASGARGQK